MDSALLDAHVHNDAGNPGNAPSVKLGTRLCCSVTNATGEFNDTVMYLYTNCAGWDIVVPIELSENLLLNLHITFHDFWPRYLFGPVSWRYGPLGRSSGRCGGCGHWIDYQP
jgi:hypothetical protein